MIGLASVLDLSRFQFAMTTIFHFFYVPLSIGTALANVRTMLESN